MQTTIERSTRSFAVPNTGFLEWEDTPSFAESLRERIQWVGSAPRSDARLAALRRLLAELGPEMLADAMRLGTDDDVRAAAAHHADTVPCELGPAVPITPFVEPIDGVAVREVSDADLFRHFFGR